MNIEPITPLLSADVGKSATAHLIASATQVYSGRGYKYVLLLRVTVDHIRFYYADARKANGAPV